AGVLDRHDGGLAAEAAGPAGDLLDVQNVVGVVAEGRVDSREVGPAGAEYQRGDADVQAALQSRVPATHRVEPADRHGEARKRLQGDVEVPLPGAADVQRLT